MAWYDDRGNNRNLIISSRIRLARNLKEFLFPNRMEHEDLLKILKKCRKVYESNKWLKSNFIWLDMQNTPPIERQKLVEKHLISHNMMKHPNGRALLLSKDEVICVMINEEDHIRIQVILAGLDLEKGLKLAEKVDDILSSELELAFSPKLGYLTSCPTNVGTGLRVSVMVHLPALVMTNQVQQVLGALAPLGLAVRGLYGEGSRAFGNIYQISNQITLGKSEEDTLTNLEAVTKQIIDCEMQAREALKTQSPLITQDKVWRARGTLENARLLTAEETFSILSDDRLGMEMEVLPKVSAGFVSLLINSLQGCLQYRNEKPLDGNLLNYERANFLRQMYQRKDG